MAGAIFLIFINDFTVISPSQLSVSNFFTAYISIPAFLVLYFGHRIVFWQDPWEWRPEDEDMQTGLQEVLEAEQPPVVRDTWGKKLRVLVD